MVNVNDIPYGALYTFQPEYLGHLIHDEINHEDDEVEVPASIEGYIQLVKDYLIKS